MSALYMNSGRFFPSGCTFSSLYIQIQSFCSTRKVNKVKLYFQRANLIDLLRLALRSSSDGSVVRLLNSRDLDSFVVANVLRSAPSPESALSMIEMLKTNPHFKHTQNTLYALAKILAKSGQVGKLRGLVNAINLGKFDNVRRVSTMDQMRWYGVAGEVDEVVGVWDEWKAVQKRTCTEAYNIVMGLYANKGKDLEAVNVFRSIVDDGALPNPRTYTVMIEHLIDSGKLDRGLDVFRMLPLMRVKRTLRQYSVLVEAAAGDDRLDIVQTLLDEMRVDGVLPGRAMQLTLQRMHQAGYVDWTDELVQNMLPNERIKNVAYSIDYTDDDDDGEEEDDANCISEESIDSVHLKPWLDPSALARALEHWGNEEVSALEDAKIVWTTRLVCKMIRSFKKAETAWNFFCWVSYQPGFTHDIYSISRMITKASRDGCVHIVDQLLSKIQREGIRLSFSTVRLIVDFYGISHCADAALRVFRSCKEICGPIPKTNLLVLYSSLLRTLAKCKMTSDTFDILEEMILLGTFPDIQTFSGLIHHFALQEDIKTVQRLFGMVRQCGMEPDTYMYKVLIHVYCKCKRAALAQRVFEDMSNSGLMPDNDTKDLLVKSLWKEGKLREAAAVEERSEELNGIVPAVVTGHLFTVNSEELMRIYELYLGSFTINEESACKSNAI
ncbi:hypothetical protein LIER_34111 [Lithospermum erythrorhizon]|uniref:Pentatricopeptide repeat-containing protein n=1 Tax=Lithospermum erythrorhizon TaxID=34254 RepID=A0AAV3RYJ3_LITER